MQGRAGGGGVASVGACRIGLACRLWWGRVSVLLVPPWISPMTRLVGWRGF